MTSKQKIILKDIRRIKKYIEEELSEDNHFPSTTYFFVANELGILEHNVITFPASSDYQSHILINWYVQYTFYIKRILNRKFRVMLRKEVREIETEQH